ncbi:GGDEF domain-containing protein [Enterovibrio makurazakiensis]|uniref:diguanylate cyclase n=1 Tax=Enterovibrio gelatinilyticus TaxID=2899819 RepID=A0ABT5QZ80_9GAMM|nr:GGDEF domain-containing protein [Enterovibrio sp. ZSDZ42]MDD1792925.1 GGDEF domain-containing protein [Enterovibrio sp. ZSDZ42]
MNEYALIEATRVFKRAVPLMVKYKVPTTPHYFSLWYAYCAGTHPALNRAVDAIVKKDGLCTVEQCDDFIETYLLDDATKELDTFRQKVQDLAADLGSSMDTTVSNTEEFQDILNSSVTKLEGVKNRNLQGNESKKITHDLLQGSQDLLAATEQYQLHVKAQRTEIEQLKQQLEDYRKQATHDALTGCLNRRAFDLALAEHVHNNNNVCLIMVDIDHFKLFNDEFGHQMGDGVLKIVANKLEQNMQEVATVYRFGGEEFSVLVTDVSIKGAWLIAEKTRKALERLSVTDKRTGKKINSITASFGIAERAMGEQGFQFLARADEALYDAKHRGRNRVMPMVR